MVHERKHLQDVVLTKRKTEIARLMALGLSRKEIGAELNISPRTVDYHIEGVEFISRGIRHCLGFCDVARITHWAILRGLVKLGEPFKKKGELIRQC